jgi:uncharacterized membrane protein YhaH (DUF805 family)
MAGGHDHGAAGRVPFWIHQLVELLLGILLLVQGARTGQHTAVLVILGGLLLLLALCSDGALAAWPWIGRRLHRILDLVAAAVLALAPLALGLDHVLPVVILEVAAAAMVWLALRTEWRVPEQRRKTAAPTPRRPVLPPASGAPTPPARPVPESPPVPAAPAVPLARKVGSAVGRARDDGPRQLGRLVGRAQRAARAAMASDDSPCGSSGRPDGPSSPPDGLSETPGDDSG